MIRVAVVGAGMMGRAHANAYAQIADVEVAAVVDTNREKAETLAAEVRASPVLDIERVLEDPEIRLVDITLPTPFHAEAAIRALQAGKHVLLEKPFARTLADIDTVIAVAQHSPTYLMVAQVLRFWPEYVAIREVVRSGRLGKPLLAKACRLSNPPAWAAWLKDDQASGGMVLDLQIHDLDVLNWIFGRPTRVEARGIQDPSGAWVHCMAQLEYGPVLAYDEASHCMPDDYPFTTGLRVICENGMVDYATRSGNPAYHQAIAEHRLMFYEPGREGVALPFTPGNAYFNEVAYFVDCVRTNRAPEIVPLEDARLAVETSLAVRAALDSGSPQTL